MGDANNGSLRKFNKKKNYIVRTFVGNFKVQNTVCPRTSLKLKLDMDLGRNGDINDNDFRFNPEPVRS